MAELGDEELDQREKDHLETESEPTRIAREDEQKEDTIAGFVPAAAEGTSALPVQAIVQGEEAEGRAVAPKEERGRVEEKERGDRLPIEEVGQMERKQVREQVEHEPEVEEELSAEGEAEIDLSEQLEDMEE